MKILIHIIIGAFFIINAVRCGVDEESTKAQELYVSLDNDEEVMRALSKVSEYEFEKEDVCIVRPESFKNLVLVGYFAHDRGCGGGVIFYEGELVEWTGLGSRVLSDNNWRNDKERLALAWVQEVQFVWESVITSEPEDFPEGKFESPSVLLSTDSVTVSCWVQEPSGMLPQSEYNFVTVVFDQDGEIQSTTRTDDVLIEY